MAVSTVSSLSESFMSGAPEERSSGHIHKPNVDASSLDETVERAEIAPRDDTGPSTTDDQHDGSSQPVETQQPI
jgi:hypothetical protein